MRSYNGAEMCDIVGLYMIKEIRKLKIFNNEEFGIYRDDGLAVIQSKALHKIFNKWVLN